MSDAIPAPSRRTAEQRLTQYRPYWDADRETMDPRLREKKIVERMQHQLRHVYSCRARPVLNFPRSWGRLRSRRIVVSTRLKITPRRTRR